MNIGLVTVSIIIYNSCMHTLLENQSFECLIYYAFVRYNHCGMIAGKLFMALALVNYFFYLLIKWIVPEKVRNSVLKFFVFFKRPLCGIDIIY